jgi:hypothetical protein
MEMSQKVGMANHLPTADIIVEKVVITGNVKLWPYGSNKFCTSIKLMAKQF